MLMLGEVKKVDKLYRAALTDPYEFGFGPRKMKETKICRQCGNMETADKYTCSKCGVRLPTQTVFQIYQKKHKTCEICDTVLAAYMRYCPHCGMKISDSENQEE